MDRKNDRRLRLACYTAYIAQAIIVNLAPLYFVIFRNAYGISTDRLALLILLNFLTQLLTDIFSIRFSTRIGLKRCAVAAHIFCAAGLVVLALFPRIGSFPYPAMLAATVVYSIGGGLLETVINPVFATLPKKEGGTGIVLMHAFYCWGQMAVILLTTLLLRFLGEDLWWAVTLGWAVLPLLNALLLASLTIRETDESGNPKKADGGGEAAAGDVAAGKAAAGKAATGKAAAAESAAAGSNAKADRDKAADAPAERAERRQTARRLLRNGGYLLCLLMILCAGAAEQAMAQWASYFAEIGLGKDKTAGDLLGACLFAFFMGLGRTLMGLFGAKLGTRRALFLASGGAVVCYLVASLAPIPLLSLLFCALTGFSVSVMWPSLLDLSALHYGATPLVFGYMSLFGDAGCMSGPFLAGKVADLVENSAFGSGLAERLSLSAEQVGIRAGLLVSFLFPLLLLILLSLFVRRKRGPMGSREVLKP